MNAPDATAPLGALPPGRTRCISCGKQGPTVDQQDHCTSCAAERDAHESGRRAAALERLDDALAYARTCFSADELSAVLAMATSRESLTDLSHTTFADCGPSLHEAA